MPLLSRSATHLQVFITGKVKYIPEVSVLSVSLPYSFDNTGSFLFMHFVSIRTNLKVTEVF